MVHITQRAHTRMCTFRSEMLTWPVWHSCSVFYRLIDGRRATSLNGDARQERQLRLEQKFKQRSHEGSWLIWRPWTIRWQSFRVIEAWCLRTSETASCNKSNPDLKWTLTSGKRGFANQTVISQTSESHKIPPTITKHGQYFITVSLRSRYFISRRTYGPFPKAYPYSYTYV